ncbi:cathepsin B [Fasciola gigantica]|uniref:Cathepsin B-like cysteine proteinase n=1 Tax=Fasciola gigantica TaxID=46835 RepID=A0A504YST9_FASGI|nr:cathepsin B [Fasciola gigantica]
MNWLIPFAVIVVVQATPSLKTRFDAFSDRLIHYVNEESGASWKAAWSARFNGVEHFKHHLGALTETPEQRKSRRPTVRHYVSDSDLPESFDARVQWPDCPSISEIRDQSKCGSCWAFGAVEAMSDRVCIHSNGRMKPHLSARDLLSCCEFCGLGCRGGYLSAAWDYWKSSGIVTGGSLEEQTGCVPYPFPKCAHQGSSGRLKPCPKQLYPTPTCERKCQVGYNKTYKEDKFYGASSYNVYEGEKEIMYEIMKNGPVEASFTVYEDFSVYKSGIYHHVTGEFLGGHAIRILGWGVENDVKYWLIANSWNEEWGENGYFRIRRGTDECGIESGVTTGMPLI